MRLNFRIFTLHHKVYWFWCLIFAAHYADWKRNRGSFLAACPKGRDRVSIGARHSALRARR
jgi:hypothetical protein